jgi:GNAT superfamily N-acetyltransferase
MASIQIWKKYSGRIMKMIKNTARMSMYAIAVGLLALTSFNAQAMNDITVHEVEKKPKINPTDVTLSTVDQGWKLQDETEQRILYKNQTVGEFKYSSNASGDALRLRHFRVDDALQGHGIGTEALLKFIAQRRDDNCKSITLDATPNAIKMYACAGFKRLDGACANVFTLNLTTPPTITYSLGAPYFEYWMPRTDRKQRIYINNIPIGALDYSDSTDDHGLNRCLKSFRIEDDYANLRGMGIGSACLQQFINEARAQKVANITLFATPKSFSLYKKCNFICLNEATRLMNLDLKTLNSQ